MKRPIRFFNTTGPCNPDKHYMLPPADRLQGAQLHRYVNDASLSEFVGKKRLYLTRSQSILRTVNKLLFTRVAK